MERNFFLPLETIKAKSKYKGVQINCIGSRGKRSLNNWEERKSAPLGHLVVWWSIFVNDAARYGDPRSTNRPTSGLSQSLITANTGIYSVIKVCKLECMLNLKASVSPGACDKTRSNTNFGRRMYKLCYVQRQRWLDFYIPWQLCFFTTSSKVFNDLGWLTEGVW